MHKDLRGQREKSINNHRIREFKSYYFQTGLKEGNIFICNLTDPKSCGQHCTCQERIDNQAIESNACSFYSTKSVD